MRLRHFDSVPSEAALTTAEEGKEEEEKGAWPSEGVVEFSGLEVRYPGRQRPALDGISFKTRPGEKVSSAMMKLWPLAGQGCHI